MGRGKILIFFVCIFAISSAVSAADSDRDGIPDDWEHQFRGVLNPEINDSQDDPDQDGLTNEWEFKLLSNPADPDTDGDGLSDGIEVHQYRTNPAMADTDSGGRTDGDELMTYRNPLNPDDDAVSGNTRRLTIHLHKGWNLISIPLIPADPAIEKVLAPISGSFNTLWAYKNEVWMMYDPLMPLFSDLKTLEPGLGYLIDMKKEAHIDIKGIPGAATIALKAGWNLVSFNSLAAQGVPYTCASIYGNYVVWSLGGDGSWTAFSSDKPMFSDLEFLDPGQGYWISVQQNCEWIIP